MKGAGRVTKIALALAVGSLLGVGSLMAAETSSGVTLVNDGKSEVFVYVSYGSGGSCESQPKSEELHIAAGASQTVDAEKACVCLQVPERKTCRSGWSELKAGSKRHFQ